MSSNSELYSKCKIIIISLLIRCPRKAPPPAQVRATALEPIPIAASWLDIDLSERPSKNDLKARPVVLEGQHDVHVLSPELLGRPFDHEKWRSSKLWGYHSWIRSSLFRLSISMSTCSICTNKCDSGYISHEKGDSNAVGRSSFNPQIYKATQLASAGLYAGTGDSKHRDLPPTKRSFSMISTTTLNPQPRCLTP